MGRNRTEGRPAHRPDQPGRLTGDARSCHGALWKGWSRPHHGRSYLEGFCKRTPSGNRPSFWPGSDQPRHRRYGSGSRSLRTSPAAQCGGRPGDTSLDRGVHSIRRHSNDLRHAVHVMAQGRSSSSSRGRNPSPLNEARSSGVPARRNCDSRTALCPLFFTTTSRLHPAPPATGVAG